MRPGVHAEIDRLMMRHITHILERQLKSVEFLKLIQREVA
jgi:hypothetical protein